MSKEFTEKNAVRALTDIDRLIERVGNETNIWEIEFYTPTGKWKYTDYVYMEKPESWSDLDVLITNSLKHTPKEFRETSIICLDNYWTVVMKNNPLGFPIMVIRGKCMCGNE